MDPIFVLEKCANHLGDVFVPSESFCVAVDGCVDDSHRIRNTESFLVMYVIDRNFARLTVGMRLVDSLFLDQLEAKIIFPLDVEDVIDHRID